MKFNDSLKLAADRCAKIRTAIQQELPYPHHLAMRVVEQIAFRISLAQRKGRLDGAEYDFIRERTQALKTFNFSETTKRLADQVISAVTLAEHP